MNAPAIATAVIDLFAIKDMSFSKWIMLTTDGAPVMWRTGTAQRTCTTTYHE